MGRCLQHGANPHRPCADPHSARCMCRMAVDRLYPARRAAYNQASAPKICPAQALVRGLPLIKAPVKMPLNYPLQECLGIMREEPSLNDQSSVSAVGCTWQIPPPSPQRAMQNPIQWTTWQCGGWRTACGCMHIGSGRCTHLGHPRGMQRYVFTAQHGMPMGALYSGAPTVLPKGRFCVCVPPVKGGMRVWTSLINKSLVATVAHMDSVVSAHDEGGQV